MSQDTMNTVSAFVGAVIAVLTYFKVNRSTVKRALLAAGIGGAAWIVLFALGSAVLARTEGVTSYAEPDRSSPDTSSDAPSRPTGKLRFVFPTQRQSVGQVVNAYGTGTIPQDKDLWIFVYATDIRRFYTAGEASVDANTGYWAVSGVTFGGDAEGDIGVPYAIYALLVGPQTSARIRKAYERDNGETGSTRLPGGANPATTPHITVVRTR